jgi:hypothetical protein
VTHILDADGACLEDCPDTAHDGPLLVAIAPEFKPLLDEWLSHLGATVTHWPTTPDENDGLRTYAVTGAEALFTPSPLEGKVGPARMPRARRPR